MSLIRELEKAGYFNTIYNESHVQKQLHQEQGGKREVILPNKRRIDLLTSQELIEVKHAKNWYKAIEQLQNYSRFYPEKRIKLHLFGLASLKNPQAVFTAAKEACEPLKITVTWEA